jgi:hypothetical protein
MTIVWLRDLIIVIDSILLIIILIGLMVGFFILYSKVKRVVNSINRSVQSVHKQIAYVLGLLKGLNETVNIFGRGGL